MSEYSGYDDEKILDLNMDRFTQMVEVIAERKLREAKQERKWNLIVAETGVKTMVASLQALARTRKAASALQKAAESVKFSRMLDSKDEEEKAKVDRTPSTSTVMRAFGLRGDKLAGVK